MNTKISYMYCDAANYKQHGEEIITGELTLDELKPYLHDHQFFIPGDVGLPELQQRFATQGFGYPSDDDHVWHELFELELTDREPTMELEGPELIERFRRASESGWKELKAMKRIGLI